MSPHPYLPLFKAAAASLDPDLLRAKGIEVEVGEWLDSVVLRLHKPRWANKPLTQPQKEAALFFSVWIGTAAAAKQRLSYNIHALKLRQLKGYKLESRKFAEAFREEFIRVGRGWPNVRTDFGPLTLMEGWQEVADMQAGVAGLARKFLDIDDIIDQLLNNYSL